MRYYKKVEKSKKIEDGEYHISQYEDYKNGSFYKKESVKARYIKQEQPNYIGNPLIEALPPIRTTAEVVSSMERFPLYIEQERTKSEEFRLEALMRIKSLLIPFTEHLEIDEKISTIIRRGYSTRNFIETSYIDKIRFTAGLLNKRGIVNKVGELKSIPNNTEGEAEGFSVCGISGGGKSTAVNNLLSYYPQCIEHTDYNNKKFIFHQLVWVKVDCSYNGSIKGICMKFFEEVDSILNTDYSLKFNKRSTRIEELIVGMGHVVTLHALGCLIIDEVQHIANARNTTQDTLNFFVTLKNELKIPILYIGTYKAINKVFNSDFRHTRRAIGIGMVEWGRMKEDEIWDDFIEKLWKMQWTKNKTELTPELKRLFYKTCMGITALATNLYMECQRRAIIDGVEEITPQLIHSVGESSMGMFKAMSKALDSGDINEISKYDDIYNSSFEELELTENDIKNETRRKELAGILNSEEKKAENEKQQLIENIIYAIALVGIKGPHVREVAKSVVEENRNNLQTEDMTRLVLQKLIKTGCIDNKENIESNKQKQNKKVKTDGFDVEGKLKNPTVELNIS